MGTVLFIEIIRSLLKIISREIVPTQPNPISSKRKREKNRTVPIFHQPVIGLTDHLVMT